MFQYFSFNVPYFQKNIDLFEGSKALIACPSDKSRLKIDYYRAHMERYFRENRTWVLRDKCSDSV
jgi:hypothetical protein